MLKALKKLKVRHKVRTGCACNKKNTVFTYILPIRLDKGIVKAMKSFGENAMPFHKTCMLKIEAPNYSIVGINKLREIKIILKNKSVTNIVTKFEIALAIYIQNRKKVK